MTFYNNHCFVYLITKMYHNFAFFSLKLQAAEDKMFVMVDSYI
jgi:hypothetical protein